MTPLIYSVLVEPLTPDEGGGYAATVPDLPGCMSDGETPEEALANVHDAIAAWIKAALTVMASATGGGSKHPLDRRRAGGMWCRCRAGATAYPSRAAS